MNARAWCVLLLVGGACQGGSDAGSDGGADAAQADGDIDGAAGDASSPDGSGPVTYALPNDDTGCPGNCRQIPWKTGSDLWNGGTLPVYAQVACNGLVADGTTDDTAALNQCIAAAASGSAVYVPAGNYYVNGTVRLKSGVVLRGAGPTTLILEGANGWLTTQDFSHSTHLDPATDYNQIPTTYTLGGTPKKGDTTLTIGSGKVSVGTWMKVFGNDDPTLVSDPGGSCDYCADDTGAI